MEGDDDDPFGNPFHGSGSGNTTTANTTNTTAETDAYDDVNGTANAAANAAAMDYSSYYGGYSQHSQQPTTTTTTMTNEYYSGSNYGNSYDNNNYSNNGGGGNTTTDYFRPVSLSQSSQPAAVYPHRTDADADGSSGHAITIPSGGVFGSGGRSGLRLDDVDVQGEASSIYPRCPPDDVPYSFLEVSQPEKVGEGFDAYTSYKVVTKFRDEKVTILHRRYRDFFWLFNELVVSFPGVVVPAPPEKKMIGRFDSDFVEHRRKSLEVMLRKTCSHPILCLSPSLKTFLQSETIEPLMESKRRDTGIFDLVSGVMPDFSFGKRADEEPWFEEKTAQISLLETQLRTMQRRVENIMRQRKELGGAINSFWDGITKMSSAETNAGNIFKSLTSLGEIQLKVETAHQKQSAQYVTNFGFTVDLYIRTITSAKMALQTRENIYRAYQADQEKLVKRKERMDKLIAQNKGDAVAAIIPEVEELKQKAAESKQRFADVSSVLKVELRSFDEQMTRDFRHSMESFVGSMSESQQEILHWWQSYLPELQQRLPQL